MHRKYIQASRYPIEIAAFNCSLHKLKRTSRSLSSSKQIAVLAILVHEFLMELDNPARPIRAWSQECRSEMQSAFFLAET